MKLYIIEGRISGGLSPKFARKWVSTQSDAATTRKEFNQVLEIPRSAIRTTTVEVDTRKEALVPLLNKLTTSTGDYLYAGDE